MQLTVLCIDDDESGLLIRKLLLESEGYRVLTSVSGPKGLLLLSKQQVDAVILDFQMPGMNGAEVAKRIRAKRPKLPIILLSGYPESVPGTALPMVDAFVKKGDPTERLLALLRTVVRTQHDGAHTILNVDDNAAHRYPLTRVLRQAGYKVVEAVTGTETLALAQMKPSLILLDVNLPDLNGFEVCKSLRANPVTQLLPIMIISATFTAEVVQAEAQECGANWFIEYPNEIQQFPTLVSERLRECRGMQC
jgi:CheY-like chemotaxis protein